jgi:hypothetical protein
MEGLWTNFEICYLVYFNLALAFMLLSCLQTSFSCMLMHVDPDPRGKFP